jgi:HPt (histidine-containing phosphotransfer) domain-containing protein
MKAEPRVGLQEFEALARAYREELSSKLAAMEGAAGLLVRKGWDRSVVESLSHQAHRLVGSSGIYGLADLTRAAGVLDELLKELLQEGAWPPPRSPAELATVVKAVRQAARAPRGRRRQGAGPGSSR